MRLAGVHIPPALRDIARGFRTAARIRVVVGVGLTLAVAVALGSFAAGAGLRWWWLQTLLLLLMLAGLFAVLRWASDRARREATRLVHEHKSCVCGGQPAPPTRTPDAHELYTCAACGDSWELDEHGDEVFPPTHAPSDAVGTHEDKKRPLIIAGVHIPHALRGKFKALQSEEYSAGCLSTFVVVSLLNAVMAMLRANFGPAADAAWAHVMVGSLALAFAYWMRRRRDRRLRPKVQALLNAEGFCVCGYPSVTRPGAESERDRLCPECGATWTIAPPAT